MHPSGLRDRACPLFPSGAASVLRALFSVLCVFSSALSLPAQVITTVGTNVGIGTTTPSSKLHVNDATALTSFTGLAPGQVQIQIPNTNGNFAKLSFTQYDGQATAAIGMSFTGSGSKLHFGTSNNWGSGVTNTAMTIDYSGNVGIGTTSPSNLLYLRRTTVGNPGYNPVLGLGYDDAAVFGGTLGLRVVPGNPRQGLKLSSNLNLTFHSPVTNSNPAFQWQTGSVADETADANTVMTVTGAGNVGIGTASPDSLLTTYQNGRGQVNFYGTHGLSSGARSVFIQGSSDGVSIIGSTSLNASRGDFAIYTADAERIRVSTAGNVGIGTTNPANRLHIDGTTGTPTSIPLRVDVGDNGSIAVRGTSAISYVGYTVYKDAAQMWFTGREADNYVVRTGGGANVLTAENSGAVANTLYLKAGNVGIGTSNPLSRLHVQGIGRFGLNDAGTNNIGGILVASGTGVGGARQYWIGASNPTSHNNNMFQISDYDGSTNSPLLTIYGMHAGPAGGNVGIGTTTPGSKLTINGPTASAVGISFGNADAGITASRYVGITRSDVQTDLGTNSGFSGLEFGGPGSAAEGFLAFHTHDYGVASGERMRIDKSGNIGIGTTAPTQKLQFGLNAFIGLPGGSGSYVPVAWQRGYSGIILAGSSSADGASGWSHGSRLVNVDYGDGLNAEFDTVNASAWTNSALVISSRNGRQGNVGIGTGSPDYKLHVAGSVRATSFIANANTYADFVFQPGYRLAPLDEVEALIKEQGHLPDIPSETEARRDGIDVARMQAKLLQKVEELTLHLIRMEKENTRLRQRVDQLESAAAQP